MPLAETKHKLKSLLDYTKELLDFRRKVVLDLAEAPYPVFYEGDLLGLEGVSTAPDPEAWLQVKRLKESSPPAPEPMFEGWYAIAPNPSPNDPPKLLDHRMLRLPIEEISDLVEAELLDPEDVLRPRDADEDLPPLMDAILRTSRLIEFKRAWDGYVDGPWKRWAEVEKPRRRSIEVYNRLFAIHQRSMFAGEEGAVETVWGIGLTRWQYDGRRINVPLLEQLVEIELIETDGTIRIVPRGMMPPQLSLGAFHELAVDGVKSLQRDAAGMLGAAVEDADLDFSPFDKRGWEKILQACAARLSSAGVYVPAEPGRDTGDRTVPTADGTLRVSDTWVIFARQRREDIRLADIDRLGRKIDAAASEGDLPAAGLSFVKEPSDTPVVEDFGLDARPFGWTPPSGPGQSGDGSSGGPADVGAGHRRPAEHFFPLPFNDQQMEILERLETSDGVVVQGPPGTGKTHTIANIVCHYMANGGRVLVTAKSAEALTALHEKFPEGIADLAISVIHSDREGARQLDSAVRVLANEAKTIDVRQTQADIRQRQARMAEIEARMRAIDGELASLARRHLDKVGTDELLPMDLARRVHEERDRHAWFTDRPVGDGAFVPRFTDAQIAEAGQIRRRLGPDLRNVLASTPAPATLPEAARVLAAHSELTRAGNVERAMSAGSMLLIVAIDSEKMRTTRSWLAEYQEWTKGVRDQEWLLRSFRILAGIVKEEPARVAAIKERLGRWHRLHEQGSLLALAGIGVDHVPSEDAAYDDAVAALARGKRPFGLFSFGKSETRSRIERTTVAGALPATADHWREVREYRQWQAAVMAFIRDWTAVAATLKVPPLDADWIKGSALLFELGPRIGPTLRLSSTFGDISALLRSMFPHGVDVRVELLQGDPGRFSAAIDGVLERGEAAAAEEMRTSLSALAGDGRTPLQRGFGDIAQALGDPGVDPAALKAGWDDVVAEARRVHKLLGDRLRLEEIAASIRVSGAVEWSERLLRSLVDGDTDPLTPPDWRRSWDWARDDAFIRSISDTDRFQVLSEDRASLDDESRRLLASIVRLKTFLELKRRLAPSVEGALAAFAAAVRRLGAGTGASAGRHRKVIRDAALKASAAVPCWIMPEWRVSEQLPPELGAFDLVIVDEASQSDVSALPVILRGKKLLIVGDDKQVSPTMIGVEERTIVQLRHTYLDGLPYADHMDPTTSLYELGGMLFPGKAIMLREHFRCVEPIIRFSSRFYNHDLVPMRLPKQSERLEPPLIDILVRNGRRTGDVNRQEADVIVEEIGKIAADPAFERRSIGVISLLGDKQAKLIGDRLIRELGAEVVERHRILCGSSAVLQGQERDIVFLSMVYCPKTVTMQRSAIYEQRFNVAMSRARDRLVLVRSVTPSDLKPGDLKLQVIEHFRSPMEGGSIQGRRDALALAESPFEKEFGAALLDLGYRIRPQVSVGGFRIDFVVEGEDNRRLAIELDGDRYHGPERWAEDFRRQLALERLGWTFWRCWGSSWVAERDVCIADLRRKLDALGIEPLGAEPVGGDWTEHRQIGESEGAIDGAAGKEPAAPPSGARSGEPASTTEESASPAPAPPTIDPVASAPNPPQEAQVDLFSGSFGGSEPSVSVEPGDLVVVRYEDQPKRPLRVRISTSRNAPTEGLLHVDEPLAKAVLGSMVGDEVEVVIGSGKARYAVIESIEKALAAVA